MGRTRSRLLTNVNLTGAICRATRLAMISMGRYPQTFDPDVKYLLRSPRGLLADALMTPYFPSWPNNSIIAWRRNPVFLQKAKAIEARAESGRAACMSLHFSEDSVAT